MEKIYTIKLLGAGGHGSRPDLSRNPILCYGAFVSALMGVCPRDARVRILSAVSGNGANVIPETAEIKLSVITPDGEKDSTDALLERVLNSVCKIYHCQYEILI